MEWMPPMFSYSAPQLEGTGEQKNPLTPGKPVDRILLLNPLKRLGPSDLSTLIAAIPGASGQVSRNGTGPEKVAELVGWAESSTGPGLQEVHRIAQQVLENFRCSGRRRARPHRRSRRTHRGGDRASRTCQRGWRCPRSSSLCRPTPRAPSGSWRAPRPDQDQEMKMPLGKGRQVLREPFVGRDAQHPLGEL